MIDFRRTAVLLPALAGAALAALTIDEPGAAGATGRPAEPLSSPHGPRHEPASPEVVTAGRCPISSHRTAHAGGCFPPTAPRWYKNVRAQSLSLSPAWSG